MEIDIRKAKEDENVESIRWGEGNKKITNMDNVECVISQDIIQIEDIDNLILALKKYKELYGGNVS